MSNDVMQDLELKSILGIVLPAVIVAEVIAVFIALGVGLFSSRKIAVPLYKIENWISRLKDGKLNTTLAFREEDDMKELTNQCNSMAEFYRKIFAEIHEHAENIALKANDSPSVIEQINKIKRILDRIEM
jgi:methyl-accepting chemotaxis protein